MISVIVPIYYGKEYIPGLIKLIENCKKALGNVSDVELVLSNDAPDDELDNYESEEISILVLNTSVNRGMQGARVEGIHQCKGEYILMLDQDDWIAEDYLKSQMKELIEKKGDACVCRAISENKPAYDSQHPFEKINDLEYALRAGVCILSPGQVLMKKSVISNVWKTNIMENRGADDWLLWICMLAEGVKFVLNEDILFEHIENGQNTSLNSVKMMRSDYEMIKILKNTHTLSDGQLAIFEDSVEKFEIARIQLLDKFRKMFFVYDTWMKLSRNGKTISQYLKINNKMNICIYGIGYIGKALFEELKMNHINVVGVFDRNAEYIEDIGMKISSQVVPIDDAELVIVTMAENTSELCRCLMEKMGIPVITINELLNEIEKI